MEKALRHSFTSAENFSLACVNSCSGHGECYDGTCVCEVQYSGRTCSDPNFNYYIAFATIFYLIFGVSLIQLVLCIKAEYDKMKPSFVLAACRVTTQKALYVVICIATALRGIYFSVPKPEAVFWAFSLLSAYYPILLTGASLVVCFWAEVFHLKNLSLDGQNFLSKSLLGFIAFNIITYSLLVAELLLLKFVSSSDEEQTRLISIFQGCYAVLMLIVVIFFLIYGVEVYFKVRGEFIQDSSPASTNVSQLHQSRIGLVSQAMLILFLAAFVSSDSLGSFWKDKVPVLSRNCYDVLFRLIEMGVVLWFPCVLWNCTSPEQLWILNPRKLFKKLETPAFFHSGEDEALAASLKVTTEDMFKTTETRLCWICYDAEAQNSGPLIQPCNCKGDMSAVHHECLKKWLMRCSQTSGTRCKVCNEKYVLECYTRWLPDSITALNWIAVAGLVVIMPGIAAGVFLFIHHFSNMGLQALVAGSGMLAEYICLKLLAFNVLKGYQKGKIAAVTILSKNNRSDQPLILQAEEIACDATVVAET